MLTHNARPGESGRSAPAPLPASAAGVPIVPPRNIKASVGWLWQEKAALRHIGQHYRGDRLRAARSVYLALTEIASNQFTPARAHTSCAYLGELAGLGENAVRRYLHEFVQFGIVAVEPGIHRANTYLLLAGSEAEQDTAIATSEMKLADSAGVSRAPSLPRGAAGDPPGVIEPSPHDTPATIRATRGGTQDIRIKQNKKEIQTNRGVVADSCFSLSPGESPAKADASAMLLIASDKLADIDNPGPQSSVLGPQHSVTALTSIGVRREVAANIAQTHDEQHVLGWVRYAKTAPGLKSRAGFVLSMLRQDQAPPAPPYVNPIWTSDVLFSPPEPSEGLTAASEAAPPDPAPSPSASEQAVWLAAKDELLAAASGGVKLWLQHMRLIRVEADRLVLSSPPLGSYAAHAASYAAPMAELLGAMLGRQMEVEFQIGWLGGEYVLSEGKAETYTIESINANLRTYLGRLRGKSRCFSRKLAA